MIRNLVRHGNSLALIIDRAILELLEMHPDDELLVKTLDGQRLIVEPLRTSVPPATVLCDSSQDELRNEPEGERPDPP